jgi:DHA1 family bicyclomycin/chloramphenicol resistance-like MFS transporter
MVSAGYMLGNFLAGRLSVRFSAAGLIFAGIGLLALGLAALSLYPLFGGVRIWLLFAPMVLVAISNGLIIPAGTASAISVRPDVAGSGAGIAGFLQIGTSALATSAVSLFHDGSMAPTLSVMLVCGVVSLMLLGWAELAHHKAGRA